MGQAKVVAFGLDRFIGDCRAALSADLPHKAVREVVARAVSAPTDAVPLGRDIICIGLDLIGQVSDLGVRLRASDRSDQQVTAAGWLC